MSKEVYPVSVHILDKEYRVACTRGEEDNLINAARYLDSKMREIRTGGKVIGGDRIAVMAALNMAHDLIEHENSKGESAENLGKRLQFMQEKIDAALNQGNQLDI